jgi:hypothetical protein
LIFQCIPGELREGSRKLTEQEEHALAVACCGLLYEFIDHMEKGEEMMFADEVGSWRILDEEKQGIAASLSSLAAVASPESFTATALPLLKRDILCAALNDTFTCVSRLKKQRY